MATENNTQINSFIKGMNSDISYQMIQDGQYTFAKNIRITSLNGTNKTENINGQGEVRPIEGIKVAYNKNKIDGFKINKIYAADTIRNYGVIVFQNNDNNGTWCVARLKNKIGGNKDNDDQFNIIDDSDIKVIFGPTQQTIDKDKISISLRYEDNDNIKLYIADGKNPIMVLNIAESQDQYNLSLNGDIEKIQSYPNIQYKPPVFCGLTFGKLKPALVQYSYRLYNKNGIATDISPATKLIPIVSNKNTDLVVGKDIEGVIKEEDSNCGVKLEFDVSDQDFLDYILIYRITYVENGQLPTIELISDKKLDKKIFQFEDIGQTALQNLSLQEYNSMSGIHIIPNVIESKNDRLFAANIKHQTEDVSEDIKNWDARTVSSNGSCEIVLKNYAEDNENEFSNFNDAINFISEHTDHDCYNKWLDVNTSYTDLKDIYCFDKDGYYGGTGKNISWRFVKTMLDADKMDTTNANYVQSTRISFGEKDQYETYYDTETGKSYIRKFYVKSDGTEASDYTFEIDKITKYLKQTSPGTNNYSDPLISYYFKSLRRGEIYRYGIVLYDKFGQACPVKWIADIRVPDSYIPGFETFTSHERQLYENIYDLNVYPIGIEFKVDNLPEDIKAYEIVRCTRTFEDQSTISQGVLSKSIQKQYRPNNGKYFVDESQTEEETVFLGQGGNYKQYPFTPSGFLTCCNYWTGIFPAYYIQNYINRYLKDNDAVSARWGDGDRNIQIGKKVPGRWGKYFVWRPDSVLSDNVYSILENIQTAGYLYKRYSIPGSDDDPMEAHNWENLNVFQFVSPEYCYTKDQMKTIKDYNYNISLVQFLYPSTENKPSFDIGKFNTGDAQFNYTRWQGDGSSDDNFNIKNIYNFANYNTRMQLLSDKSSQVNQIFGKSVMLPNLLIGLGLYSNYIPESVGGIRKWNIGDGGWQGIEYSYFDKNRGNLIKQSGRSGWKDVRTKADSYIKLYKKENSIDDIEYSTIIKDKNYHGKKINIRDLEIPEDRDWGYAFEDKTKDGGETSFIANYENDIISIGGEQYCNWVVGGAYGLRTNENSYQVGIKQEEVRPGSSGEQTFRYWAWIHSELSTKDDEKTSSAGVNPWNNNPGGSFFAQGGCCAVIQTEDQIDNNDSAAKYINRVTGVYNIPQGSLGTYLCNLKHDIVPYGGYTYLDRSLNTYYSYGDYVIVKENQDKISYSFNGDCYLMPFEYISAHKAYIEGDYVGGITHCVAYAIPIETNINLAYTSGYELSRNYKTQSATNIQKLPSNVNGYLVQDKPAYVYNTAYSAESRTRIFAAQNDAEQINEDDVFDYRCYYSNLKQNDERIDSWTKFQSANYLDVDTRYGEITHLRTFHNKLFFWQQKATGIFSVNERTQITDDSGLPLILGTGGVLERYDYLDDTAGMRKDQYCDTMSASTLYWFDDDHQEIKAYADGNGIAQLSKSLGVDNIMHKYADKDNIPNMFYDKKYGEVVSSVLKDKQAIVFNEGGRYFSALYTIPFDEELTFHNGVYVLNSNNQSSIAQWGVVNNTKPYSWKQDYTLRTYIEYIVNKSPLQTKVFDNQEIVTHNKPHNYKLEYPHIDTNAYYSKHHNYTWTTDLNDAESTLENEITLREGNYRYSIPRATNEPYGDRVRGKYMICSIEDTEPDYDSSISYIITKFRGSQI